VINIYFIFCRTNSVRDLIFCLILYVVNYGRVGKYNMRKSKRYASPLPFCIRAKKQQPLTANLVGQIKFFRASLSPPFIAIYFQRHNLNLLFSISDAMR
jgi:hypothetical protein